MNNFDLCRRNLYERLGVEQTPVRDKSKMQGEIRRMSAKLAEIRELAEPRLIMGGIRYGSDWEHEPLMDYMQSRFNDYRETGNFEMLVDLFNFIAVEGVLRTHPNYNFTPKDRA